MKHGRSAYTVVRCRCDICIQANRDYQKKYREERTARYAWAQRKDQAEK